MSDQHEHDEETGKPKFKVVDKRRINLDDIDDIEAVEEAPVKAEEPVTAPAKPVSEEPVAEKETAEPAFEPEFAPGVDKPPPDQQEMTPEEDPLAFRNIILNIMQTVVTVALVDLGLVPHPQTNLVAKKLEEARKAIELFEILMKKYGDELPEQLRTEFNRALQDLKAGYVNQL